MDRTTTDDDTSSDSETLKGTAVIKYPRLSPIEPVVTAETVQANVTMNKPTNTGESLLLLNAPSTIQPEPNPAEPAETVPLTHDVKVDESKATYPVKYVSKFNPRIYMNKRRALRDTGEKTHVSMGVQSIRLTLSTTMFRLLRSRKEEWQGNMFLALGTFSLGLLADTSSSQT